MDYEMRKLEEEISNLKKDIKTLFTLIEELRNEIEELKIKDESKFAEIENIYNIINSIKLKLLLLEKWVKKYPI